MYIVLQVVEFIAVITLFIICYSLARKLKLKDEEISALNSELDGLKFSIARDEYKLTEDILRVNSLVVEMLKKVQSKYAIYKSDKLILMEFLILFMRNVDSTMIYKVNIGKKYTFKEATNSILKYIDKPEYTDKQVRAVLDAVYYLLTRPVS